MNVGAGGLPRSEVPAAFDAAAAGYDGLVGLNPGYHAHLRISAWRSWVSRPVVAGRGCSTRGAAPVPQRPPAGRRSAGADRGRGRLDDPNETLRRFAGLLRPGGRLAVHEYSVGDSRRATATWNAVCAVHIGFRPHASHLPFIPHRCAIDALGAALSGRRSW